MFAVPRTVDYWESRGWVVDPDTDPGGDPTAYVTATQLDAALTFGAQMIARASTATAEYATSIGEAAIVVQDGAEWVEAWADDAAWSDPGVVAVADGQGYTAAGGAGTNRALVVPAGGNARVVTTFEFPGAAGGTGTEWIFFGFSSNPAGDPYSLGGHFGMGIETLSGQVQGWNGTGTTNVGGLAPAGDYVVTACADAEVVTFTLSRVGSFDQWTYELPRSHGAVNNVAIWLSDSRLAAGARIGPIGAKVGAATTTPPAGNPGLPSVHYGDTGGPTGATIRYTLPAGFDSRRPTPMVVNFHGAGGVAGSIGALEAECLDAGYIYVTSDGYATNSVGAAPAVAEYTRVYEYMLARYPIAAVALVAESMGGAVAANTLGHRGIPLPACWVGYFPLLNLQAAWANNLGDRPSIIEHYGVNPDGSDLAELTAGYSPVQADPATFAGVPCLFFHSPADTVVAKVDNSDAFAAAVEGYSEVTIVETEGEHGDASNVSPANVALAVAFLRTHLGR